MSHSTNNELQDELAALAERFVAEATLEEWYEEHVLDLVRNAPAECAGNLLGGYVHGDWDLSEGELGRLWLIGRRMGYAPEELLPDSVLRQAAPGRGQRPVDPPDLFPPPPLLPGGGHGPGRPGSGKRTFPARWSDDDSIAHTMDVARQPSTAVELPVGDFRAQGERDGVLLGVVVSPQGRVRTSYPISGDGVVQNPLSVEQAPYVERLTALVQQVADAELRAVLQELVDAGEWPHAYDSLRELSLDDVARADLEELARATGMTL